MTDFDVIRRRLLGDLHGRYFGLAHVHEDLAAAAVADLVQWLDGREEEPSEEDALKLARRILQRRVADFFRARVREEVVAPVTSTSSLSERDIEVRRLALTVLDALSELDASDRELLLGSTDGPMTAAARKRRERVRGRLRTRVQDEMGASIEELLGEGEGR